MTFKEILSEMAQNHIDNDVVQKILDGEYQKAAEMYISNIEKTTQKVPQKSSGTTTKLRKGNYADNLAADEEMIEKVTDEMWDEFDAAYKEQVKKEGLTKERKRTKGQAQKTKEGQSEIETSAHGQKAIKDQVEERLVKVRREYEQMLEKTEDEDKKEEIQGHIDGLNIMLKGLRESKKGAVLTPEKQEEIKSRYEKIQDRIKKSADKEDDDEDDEEEDKYDEKEAAAAVDKIRTRLAGMKNYDDVEELWKEWLKRKNKLESDKNENTLESKLLNIKEELV